jgi:hypothetical protein
MRDSIINKDTGVVSGCNDDYFRNSGNSGENVDAKSVALALVDAKHRRFEASWLKPSDVDPIIKKSISLKTEAN